ncbi:uncharacterized protein DSM5745_00002 [Aspergillus mulundensis]|uniref:Cyanovirin-N domain-containing protein n=1 Tax=Aspergillus mulundensis TaxID=1810919 RepID=A0A3D8T2C1_9EURO|nr:hypothetical protein DSM5745_00002 [Aspergillus mulundensis]RDW92680.1 hypothetical protein DSM5745_00002 [Aspergillus mulundensis]
MRIQIPTVLVAFFAMVSADKLTCATEDNAAPWSAISDGMHWIGTAEHSNRGFDEHGKLTMDHPGSAVLPANRCTRLYCNNGGAFWWCNEGERERYMGIRNIREGAAVIARDCPKYSKEKKTWAGGHLEHDDKWTVWVEFDHAC